ncbi:hypothetical protein [Aliarcobacter cryaerophilus]|uniref:hypothetical protein n=1 Tax=Aliarcobacter cryaerophilus TaxID=28198 RepID=UPI0021B5047E|nr:hypothetical protein [Aliarcobacter cryaerophilus]MCT7530423.1 hypothetical protein [Aliarcobacter cryaerophilus]
MKYAVYYKYEPLLKILENSSFINYIEVVECINNYLMENDKDLINHVEKTMDSKLFETLNLLKGLRVKILPTNVRNYIYDNYFESEFKVLREKKANKIINALNLVNFTNINTLNYKINIYQDKKILSPSYYKIKDYYYNKYIEIKNETFTSFLSNFGDTLEKITKEEVEYLNKCISVDKNDQYTQMDLKTIYEIRFILYIIKTLKRNRILTTNFMSKQKHKFKKLIDELPFYGIKKPYELTIDNPTKLYAEIDFILTSNGLNDDQKNIFYRELDIRERNPKTIDVKEVSEILEEDRLTSEVAKYPLKQLEAIINKNNNFEFNEEYYRHLTKYGIEKIFNAISIIDNNYANIIENSNQWFDYKNKLDKEIIGKLFTSTSKSRIPYLFDLEYDILDYIN